MAKEFDGELKLLEQLKGELAARSKDVVYKTISAKTKTAQKAVVKAEATDGWLLSRHNKKSVRLQRPKDSSHQLEDDVW